MKKILFGLITVLFILTGCQNDDEQTTDLNAEEAKLLVEGSASSLSDDIVSLVESEGAKGLMKVADFVEEHSLIAGRASQKVWTKNHLESLIGRFVDGPSARVNSSNPSSFEDIKGLYVWNFDLQKFDVTASDFFIVQFPADGSSTNNAEFKISNLEFVTIKVLDGVEEDQVPSTIAAHLKIDDVTVADLAYSVKWTSEGSPEEADVALFIDPFNFTIDFTDTFAKSTSLLTSISIDEDIIVSVDVDVSYETESKDDPFLIEGNVQYRGLKIEGNVDARKIGLDGNPNDFVNLALYSDEAKIGDIVFVLEEDEAGFKDYVPYVTYTDGSQENLETLLEPVLEEIESILTEFE